MMTRLQKSLGSAAVISALTFGGAIAAAAQTSTTTPGTPDTGAGGNATSSMLLLGTSALAALGAGAYLLRRKTVSQ